MLMQLFNGLTVFALLVSWKRYGHWKVSQKGQTNPKFRLSLLDLLLLVSASAVIITLTNVDLTNLSPRDASILLGCAAGTAFMVGFGIALIKNRWVAFVFVLILALGVYFQYRWICEEGSLNLFGMSLDDSWFILAPVSSFAKTILVATLEAGWIAGLLYRFNRDSSGGTLIASRIVTGVAGVGLVLLAIAMIDIGLKLAFQYPKLEPVIELRESRFEKLVQIGESFESSKVFESYPPAGDAALRNEIGIYQREFAGVLEVLETALDSHGRARVYELDSMDAMTSLRSIARAFSDKARIELVDGNADQSLSDSVAIMELREPVSSKQMVLFELLAIAIEGIGQYCAVESIPLASRESLADGIRRVLKVNLEVRDPELFYANDLRATWHWNSWTGRLQSLYDESDMRSNFDENIMHAVKRSNATRQQVIAMLGLELFRKDHDRYPKQLSALVPKYLPSIPYDPYDSLNGETRNPLKYAAISNASDYRLYSIGQDQVDNQGKPHEFGYGMQEERYDLNFKKSVEIENAEAQGLAK